MNSIAQPWSSKHVLIIQTYWILISQTHILQIVPGEAVTCIKRIIAIGSNWSKQIQDHLSLLNVKLYNQIN